MKNKVFFLACIFLFKGPFGGILKGNELYKQLRVLHQQIGSELIQIRKECPGSESAVYALLDKVGLFYNVSKAGIRLSEEMNEKVKQGNHKVHLLTKEVEDLRKELASRDMILSESQDQMKKMGDNVVSLAEEKQKLALGFVESDKEKKMLSDERDAFRQERDTLALEKDAIVRERNIILKERDYFLKNLEVATGKKFAIKHVVAAKEEQGGSRGEEEV